MARILVSGSLAYDRIMVFPGLFKDHFLPNKLHNINVSFAVDSVEENFGGTAGNIAYNLALLGHEPCVISTAGSDFGGYRAYLKELGIPTDTIRVDTSELTSAAYIITDKADNQIAAFSFAAGKTAYAPLPERADVAHAIIGAGSLDDMRALPVHYRGLGLSYFYDPAQEIPLLSGDELRAGIEASAGVFGNDYELGLITEKTGWDEQELCARASLVVITLGEQGSRIVSKDGTDAVDAVKVRDALDPTGAGDAYRAGFLAGTVAHLSPKMCAQIGSTVAAYAVESQGTQNHRFTMAELKTRYEAAYGETFPL